MAEIVTLVTAGLSNGSLYSLIGLGLVLIYKTQDTVNFAHGEVITSGAFVGYIAYVRYGLPYPAAIVAAVAWGLMLGIIVERTFVRPLSSQAHITIAMLTVGISFVMKGLLRMIFGGDIYTMPPMFDGAPIQFGGIIITRQGASIIVVTMILALIFALLFQLTNVGKQMRATQQNIEGARLVGISTGLMFCLAWGLAAAVGAAAGLLAAPSALLYTDMGTSFLIKGFAAAVLGGFDSLPGVIVGGLLLGVIEVAIGGYVSTALQELSGFLIVMLVLMFKPGGLFGSRVITRV